MANEGKAAATASGGFVDRVLGFLVGLGRHAKRAVRGDYESGLAWDHERATLAAGNRGPAVPARRTQDYLAWRRSLLSVACVLLLATAVVETVDLARTLSEPAGTYGKHESTIQLLLVLGWAAPVLLFFATMRALQGWTSLGASHRRLRWGWIVGFLLPIAISFVPLSGLVDVSPEGADQPADENAKTIARGVVSVISGLMSFAAALPATLSIFVGAMRAGFAVKRYAPQAAAPGVASALGALLLVCLLVPLLVVLVQLTASGLVVAGSFLVLYGLLVYPRRVMTLARPLDGMGYREIVVPLRSRASWWTLGGLLLVLIAGFTDDVFGYTLLGFGEKSVVGFWKMLEIVVEFAGRSIVTAVFLSDVLLVVVRRVWAAGVAAREASLDAALRERIAELDAAGLPGVPSPGPSPA
jgi:hypothetical protein